MVTRVVPCWSIVLAVLGLVLTACANGVASEPKKAAPPVTDNRPNPSASQSFAASIGIKVISIKPGDFLMGASNEEIELAFQQFPKERKWNSLEDEQPRHRVRITKLLGISAHEITVGQFRRFVADEGYKTESGHDGEGGFGYNAEKLEGVEQNPKYTWRNPGFKQTDDHPVVCVSWNDAMAFCHWLSRKDGHIYRLPTEAEWEYCCRAGTETPYCNGDDPEGLARVGNVADASLKRKSEARFSTRGYLKNDDGVVFIAPAGHYAPNAWGLYDMHGNVEEWCLDNYNETYYKISPMDDPCATSGRSDRVVRGGCWTSRGIMDCRSAERAGSAPDDQDIFTGFRVARVLSE